jgi:predicted alpha/beta superfamily hydrolase
MHLPPHTSNGESYVLYVHTPAACTRARPCPALYVLDGEQLLTRLRGLAEEEAQQGIAAPVVLVGVGYRNSAATRSRRRFDFTPRFDRPSPGRTTGGAEAYLNVLRREIIPYAEAHFPIDRSFRGIAGHSYGGLLATYTLICAPGLFQRHLIISPSLWFDDYRILSVVRETRSFPDGQLRVFLAAEDAPEGSAAMARDVDRLAKLISEKRPGVVQMRTFPGQTHGSVVWPAARAGLPILFSAHPPPDNSMQIHREGGMTPCRLDA